jgi:hypothetical protein
MDRARAKSDIHKIRFLNKISRLIDKKVALSPFFIYDPSIDNLWLKNDLIKREWRKISLIYY